MSAFKDLRILELSGRVTGEYCGKLIADFGADVIKLEPPGGGSSTRAQGPFAASGDPCERSGLFAYLNTNKRSLTLDLTTAAGRKTLQQLLGTVDAVLDDHPQGYLEGLGVDPATCASDHPELIVCSITPFGYDSAAASHRVAGLNIFHGSGWGYHSPSEPDTGKPPLKGAGRFLVDYESGLSAALVLAAALVWRIDSGIGQFIDVSQRESMASLADYVLGQMVAGTMDVSTRRDAFDLRGPATFFRCRDGYVYVWMSEPAHWEGMRTLLGEPAWMQDFPDRWLELNVTRELTERCRAHIAPWMQDQRRLEVADRAQKLGVPVVPVNTVEDLFGSAQMQFREFFAAVEHRTLGRLRHPTVPYRLSATPATITAPAPALGEHSERLLREASGPRATPRPGRATSGGGRAGPLQGVRVVELTKVWAGPYTGKLLALLGAEVIRVESLGSLDATRRYGVKNIDEAPGFQAINPGKCSIQLNMKTEAGRQLLKELLKKSDIFIENLRPGAAARLGLGYSALRSLKADIIAVSMSMHGSAGPLSHQTGYAPCFSAVAGLCHLVGYEDGPPQLMNIRYGDSSYGTAAAYAAVVALFHRRCTGMGQFVDVSAVEAIASMLGDSFMEYSLTGHVPCRDGNRHPDMAPHGCYPCRGDDWISIAVGSDAEWRALCTAMQAPALGRDPRFVDGVSRQRHLHDVDANLAAWTHTRDAGELEVLLRKHGVAAFKSLNSIDLVADEQLWQRGFYTHVADDRQCAVPIVGAPWRLAATPASLTRAAPRIGEHNDYVFGEVLGLSVAQRRRLIEQKIIY